MSSNLIYTRKKVDYHYGLVLNYKYLETTSCQLLTLELSVMSNDGKTSKKATKTTLLR